MTTSVRHVLWIGLAVLLAACSSQRGDKPLDTPTSGEIRIAVDESLMPVLQAQVNAFESIYRKARLHVVYVSEQEAVRLLLTDSVRLAVITRHLTSSENKALRDRTITPKEIVVARESVAVILNPTRKDSTFTRMQLMDVLMNGGQPVVFDNPEGGIVRFVRDSLMKGREFPESTFALRDNPSVIAYISKQHEAIGFIGGAWISDRDDSTARTFLKGIRVAAIENGGKFYQPFQAYIVQNLYPFSRNIIVFSREPRTGLGSGFMSFVAGDKGQRIFLKSGLVPATMPVRLVEVTREPVP